MQIARADNLSWNTWAEPAQQRGTLLPAISDNEIYKLRLTLSFLDLSRAFPAIRALPVSGALGNTVAKAVENKDRYLELDIYAFSDDPTKLDIEDRRVEMKVNLSNLAGMRKLEPPSVADLSKDLSADTSPTYFAGDTSLRFRTHGIGDQSTITFVVVDRESGISLDVKSVVVCKGSACPQAESHAQAEIDTRGVFPKQQLTLVLFDRKPASQDDLSTLSALLLYPGSANGPRSSISWNTGLSLTELGDLADAIKNFNESATTELAERGRLLSQRIFRQSGRAPSDSDRAAAASAKSVMLKYALASRAGPPSNLWVMMAPRSKQPLPIIPFPLFAFSNDGDPVYWGNSFALSVALPGQKFSDADCPGEWVALVPPNPHKDEILNAARSGMKGVLDNWQNRAAFYDGPDGMTKFKEWIGGKPLRSNYSSVLALVGHYNDQYGFYFDSANGLLPVDITRVFDRPSIAIVNACESTGKAFVQGSLIGQLAINNVQSIVATTAKVPATLAAAYMDCFNYVVGTASRTTMAHAHFQTVQCLWSPKTSTSFQQRTHDFNVLSLKYLLFGNPGQSICMPTASASSKPQ